MWLPRKINCFEKLKLSLKSRGSGKVAYSKSSCFTVLCVTK